MKTANNEICPSPLFIYLQEVNGKNFMDKFYDRKHNKFKRSKDEIKKLQEIYKELERKIKNELL